MSAPSSFPTLSLYPHSHSPSAEFLPLSLNKQHLQSFIPAIASSSNASLFYSRQSSLYSSRLAVNIISSEKMFLTSRQTEFAAPTSCSHNISVIFILEHYLYGAVAAYSYSCGDLPARFWAPEGQEAQRGVSSVPAGEASWWKAEKHDTAWPHHGPEDHSRC